MVRPLARVRAVRAGVGEERVGRERDARLLDAPHGRDVIERVGVVDQRRAERADQHGDPERPAERQRPGQVAARMRRKRGPDRRQKREREPERGQEPQPDAGVEAEEMRRQRQEPARQQAERERERHAAGPLDLAVDQEVPQEHRPRPEHERERRAGHAHGRGNRGPRGARRVERSQRRTRGQRTARQRARRDPALAVVSHGPTLPRPSARTASSIP